MPSIATASLRSEIPRASGAVETERRSLGKLHIPGNVMEPGANFTVLREPVTFVGPLRRWRTNWVRSHPFCCFTKASPVPTPWGGSTGDAGSNCSWHSGWSGINARAHVDFNGSQQPAAEDFATYLRSCRTDSGSGGLSPLSRARVRDRNVEQVSIGARFCVDCGEREYSDSTIPIQTEKTDDSEAEQPAETLFMGLWKKKLSPRQIHKK